MNTTRVVDEGDLRKYRTELPNLVDDMNLSVYAFRLYAHYKRVAGGTGYCNQSARTLAQHCNMAIGSITKAKEELVARGLIVVEKGEKIKNETDVVRIVDIWEENFLNFSSKKAQLQASSDKSQEVSEGVHVVNTPPVHVVNTPVQEMNTPVHVVNKRNNNSKKEPKKKEQRERGADAPPKPTDHPLIQSYREVFKRYPDKRHYDLILGSNPPIADWIRAMNRWNGKGYRPENIDGILDWANNPHLMENGNGRSKPDTMRRGDEIPEEWYDENGQYTGGWTDEELAEANARRAQQLAELRAAGKL